MFISGHFYVLGMRKTRKYISCVVIKNSQAKCAKLHTVAASNNRDHPTRSLYSCLFTSYIFVCCSLRTSHLWRIALPTQHQLRGCNNFLFAVNRIYRTFFLKSFHMAPPSHPGQNTILLRLESPGGKYAKLHTVAASNSRDLTSCSLYFYLFATHILYLYMVLFFT